MPRLRASILLLSLVLATVFSARASSPSAGTISSTKTSVGYQGGTISDVPPVADPSLCLEGQNCDTFLLTVAVPANFYQSQERDLTISIAWKDPSNDLDLYVCSGESDAGPTCLTSIVDSSAASSGTSEAVVVHDPAPGPYRVIAAAFSGSTDKPRGYPHGLFGSRRSC